jgi:thiol-disulfide isomerase/thioredoxin
MHATKRTDFARRNQFMNPTFLSQKFAAALPYDRYVQTGTPAQQQRWQQVQDAAGLTPAQSARVAGFVREMRLLVVSGIWCGDCVEQCPLLHRIAEANPDRVLLRLLDRDEHKDLSSQLRINGGDRVPVVLFLAEDHELCGVYGDRPLSRYRALAARQLGPACPTGLVVPEQGELAATLQDWLDEVERVQFMLRLSARLRQKHGD